MNYIRQIILVGILITLSACNSKTIVTGTIYNEMGVPMPNVDVTLGFSTDLQSKTISKYDGKFLISLEESCFIICAGGDPELSLLKDGYQSIIDYVPRFQTSKHKYHLKPFIKK